MTCTLLEAQFTLTASDEIVQVITSATFLEWMYRQRRLSPKKLTTSTEVPCLSGDGKAFLLYRDH